MSVVSFSVDDRYSGSGVSAGIPRGLLVHRGEVDLTQEGLGLGTVALRKFGLTYFPSTSTTDIEGSVITKKFTVDSALVFESPLLPMSGIMRLYGLGTRVYMMLPGYQERFLDLRSNMFSWLKVRPRFRRTRPLATVIFTYLLHPDLVTVRATIRSLDKPLMDVFIMNELGADHFASAVKDGRTIPPPSGWCPLPEEMPFPALMDEEHRMVFTIDRVRSCEGADIRLFWGRERRRDLCWAGFELELLNQGGLMTMEVEYDLKFGELKP